MVISNLGISRAQRRRKRGFTQQRSWWARLEPLVFAATALLFVAAIYILVSSQGGTPPPTTAADQASPDRTTAHGGLKLDRDLALGSAASTADANASQR